MQSRHWVHFTLISHRIRTSHVTPVRKYYIISHLVNSKAEKFKKELRVGLFSLRVAQSVSI